MDCIFAEFNRLIVLLNRDVGSWERCGGTARGINSEKIPKILECIICILVPRWVKYLGCFQSYRRFRDDTRGLHIITIASESAFWNFFEKNNFILGHASFENLSWFSKISKHFRPEVPEGAVKKLPARNVSEQLKSKYGPVASFWCKSRLNICSSFRYPNVKVQKFRFFKFISRNNFFREASNGISKHYPCLLKSLKFGCFKNFSIFLNIEKDV